MEATDDDATTAVVNLKPHLEKQGEFFPEKGNSCAFVGNDVPVNYPAPAFATP